jgi:hypothetical protein
MTASGMVSIPITLEQLIKAVEQLQPNEQAQIARALIQAGLSSDLTAVTYSHTNCKQYGAGFSLRSPAIASDSTSFI